MACYSIQPGTAKILLWKYLTDTSMLITTSDYWSHSNQLILYLIIVSQPAKKSFRAGVMLSLKAPYVSAYSTTSSAAILPLYSKCEFWLFVLFSLSTTPIFFDLLVLSLRCIRLSQILVSRSSYYEVMACMKHIATLLHRAQPYFKIFGLCIITIFCI